MWMQTLFEERESVISAMSRFERVDSVDLILGQVEQTLH